MIITRELLAELRPKLNEALSKVVSKYGLQVELGMLTFSEDELNGRFNCISGEKNPGGLSNSELKYIDEFKKHGYKFDLNKDAYGKVINNNGYKFKFIGLCRKERKFPLVMKRNSMFDDKDVY